MTRNTAKSQADGGRANAHEIVQRFVLPSMLRFTRDHVWVRQVEDSGDLLMLGVTEIVTRRFLKVSKIDLPEEFEDIERGDVAATIFGLSQFDQRELSFPVVTPVSGTVCPTNSELRGGFLSRGKLELVLMDPYREGWILGVIGEAAQFGDLLDPVAYRIWLQSLVDRDPTFLYHAEN